MFIMKKIQLTLLLVILFVSFSSCGDNLDNHCGEVVASRSNNIRGAYWLYLKSEGKAELETISVSLGEFNYYQNGDTIVCNK